LPKEAKMQDVVTVASQSPPMVMTSTKPAAKADQAPDQETFDLVLKKTSERINEKKCKDVNQGREQKSCEKFKNTSSTTKTSTSGSTIQKEVNGTKNDVTKEINESKDKIGEGEVVDIVDDKDESEEVIISQLVNLPVIQQPVLPLQTTVQEVGDDENDSVTVSEITDHVVKVEVEGKISQQNDLTIISVKPKTEKNITDPDEQIRFIPEIPSTGSESVVTTDQKIEESLPGKTDPLISYSNNSFMVNSGSEQQIKTENVQEQSIDMENAKLDSTKSSSVESQKTTNQVKTQSQEPVTIVNIERGTQKEGIEDSSPPDIPITAENVSTTSTATTSRLDEPARLAEAPKNEVISQIGTQIDQMVKTNRSTLRMQLYPEELGHIDIKIVTTHTGVGITMTADNPATQAILRSEMNSLKQNMQDAGIQLSNLNIGQGQNSDKQQMSEERQTFTQSTYLSSTISGSTDFSENKKVQLQTTAIDYRI
jgi:flagellar hook-length control protein FliK